jgi:hypothetical protein
MTGELGRTRARQDTWLLDSEVRKNRPSFLE